MSITNDAVKGGGNDDNDIDYENALTHTESILEILSTFMIRDLFEWLPLLEYLALRHTCKTFYKISQEPKLLERLNLENMVVPSPFMYQLAEAKNVEAALASAYWLFFNEQEEQSIFYWQVYFKHSQQVYKYNSIIVLLTGEIDYNSDIRLRFICYIHEVHCYHIRVAFYLPEGSIEDKRLHPKFNEPNQFLHTPLFADAKLENLSDIDRDNNTQNHSDKSSATSSDSDDSSDSSDSDDSSSSSGTIVEEEEEVDALDVYDTMIYQVVEQLDQRYDFLKNLSLDHFAVAESCASSRCDSKSNELSITSYSTGVFFSTIRNTAPILPTKLTAKTFLTKDIDEWLKELSDTPDIAHDTTNPTASNDYLDPLDQLLTDYYNDASDSDDSTIEGDSEEDNHN